MSADEAPTCPLPTVRDRYPAPGEELECYLGVCGQPLMLATADGLGLEDATGVATGYIVPSWHVECHGGHVLLTLDIEDREADPSADLIRQALTIVARAATPMEES